MRLNIIATGCIIPEISRGNISPNPSRRLRETLVGLRDLGAVARTFGCKLTYVDPNLDDRLEQIIWRTLVGRGFEFNILAYRRGLDALAILLTRGQGALEYDLVHHTLHKMEDSSVILKFNARYRYIGLEHLSGVLKRNVGSHGFRENLLVCRFSRVLRRVRTDFLIADKASLLRFSSLIIERNNDRVGLTSEIVGYRYWCGSLTRAYVRIANRRTVRWGYSGRTDGLLKCILRDIFYKIL